MTEKKADATLRELVSQYDALRGQISYAVHCPHQGSDLVQEVFWRAVRHLGRRDPPQNGRAWLGTIARNVVRTHFRSRALYTAPESLDDDIHVDERGFDLAREDSPFDVDLEHLAQAIEALSPVSRALIIGFYFEKKGCRELAEFFGVRDAAVKSRLFRARKRIRRFLLARDKVRHD